MSSTGPQQLADAPAQADPFASEPAAERIKLRHVLTGFAVKGGSTGRKVLTGLIRGFWYLALAIYCLPVLINLRSLWRYQTTGKLVVRSYDSFMYTWLAITAAPLLTLAQKLGAESLFLGYIYLAIVAYCIYTAGRDVTWRRGWVVFAFALAFIATVWALGEKMGYPFFMKIREALAETGMYFPATWANALSVVLGVLYLQMLVERQLSGTLTFEHDKLIVRELGESAADHERSAYSIVARTEDVNEFILGLSRTLVLRPRSSKDPEYLFRHVPGLPYLMPTILSLSVGPAPARAEDEVDRLGAGDGHAEGDACHHS
jgi:hypothetical protein